MYSLFEILTCSVVNQDISLTVIIALIVIKGLKTISDSEVGTTAELSLLKKHEHSTK